MRFSWRKVDGLAQVALDHPVRGPVAVEVASPAYGAGRPRLTSSWRVPAGLGLRSSIVGREVGAEEAGCPSRPAPGSAGAASSRRCRAPGRVERGRAPDARGVSRRGRACDEVGDDLVRRASNGWTSRKNDVSFVVMASTTPSPERVERRGRGADRTSSARPDSPCCRTTAASRASTRYSLPASRHDGRALPADELARGSRTSSREGQRRSLTVPSGGGGRGPAADDGAQRGARASARSRRGAGPRRRGRPARRPRACPRRRWSPRPGRARGRRRRAARRGAGQAVVAHAGQDDGERAGAVDLRRPSGTARRRRAGTSSPAARRRGAGRRRRRRLDAAGGSRRGRCTRVPGSSGMPVRGLHDRHRRSLPSRRSASSRVNTGGMCWTITTGTGQVAAAAPASDLAERVRARRSTRR